MQSLCRFTIKEQLKNPQKARIYSDVLQVPYSFALVHGPEPQFPRLLLPNEIKTNKFIDL